MMAKKRTLELKTACHKKEKSHLICIKETFDTSEGFKYTVCLVVTWHTVVLLSKT